MYNIENMGLIITNWQDGITASSLKDIGDIKEVKIDHDNRNGKNEIRIRINGEVVFRYDPNSKGKIVNHIQEVE
ncbi:MAG: hypothetical protein ABS939_08325 [Psychrobacillus sp.]